MVPLVAIVLATIVSTLLFISALCLCTKIGFALAGPIYPPRYNVVAKFGEYGTHGGLIKWNPYIAYYIVFVMMGQWLMSFGVWVLYAITSKGLGRLARVMRRLGLLGACSVAPLSLVASVTVSLWQILSITSPSTCRVLAGMRSLSRIWMRACTDPIVVVGVALLLVVALLVAAWIIRRHGACRRSVREALLGIRADNATNLHDA